MSTIAAIPQSKAPAAQRPTLAVMLCVNRRNPWLAAAIGSVLGQDDPDFEFLIAANACPDALWQELQNSVKDDRRVKLFRTAVGQLAFNLNFLASEANADYLVRMDADDLSEPHRIRTLRNALMGELVDVLGSAVILIDDNDIVIGRIDFPLDESGIVAALATRTAFCHPAIAIRRQFLLDMRGYLGGFASEDTDLWLRARRAGARLRNLPDTLLRYRIHADQATANRSGYAEVAAHWLRELLLKPSLYTLKGFVVALTKCFVSTWLPRSSRYQSRRLLRDDASK
jgi:glycosyltransferase involved in cell wall biosynthesis